MIELIDVYKAYDDNEYVIEGINLHIKPAEIVLISGPNGSGKTSLLNLMSLMEFPTKGRVIINQIDVSTNKHSARAKYRKNIGYVASSPLLLEDETIFNNVAYPLALIGAERLAIKRDVDIALDTTGLSLKSNTIANNISALEKKRLAVARCIVQKPEILIIDDIDANLDQNSIMQMLQLVDHLNSIGLTIIMSSNNQRLLDGIDSKLIVLSNNIQ